MEKCSETTEDMTQAILAFDTLYTTNHMKILKLLLPYLEQEHQKKLAVFIKWQELLFTLNFFKQYSVNLYSSNFKSSKKPDFNTLFPLLAPYCSETEKKFISQFSQMQTMMHTLENVQQYMPMIQQFMSSMSDESNPGGMFQADTGNMMDLLKNMMSEEQQAMFSMFINENL